MLSINKYYYKIVDFNSFICYFESNFFFFGGSLGILKFSFMDSLYFYIEDMFYSYIKSSFLSTSNSKLLRTHYYNRLVKYLKSIVYGFDIKYKVIGLGHRGYYSKNLYLFKIGYSHLVFCFLPIYISAKKKKKKKLFHKLYSIRNDILSNTFFHLQNFRVPDIYSSNGIYNRIDFYIFKKGKKSFML